MATGGQSNASVGNLLKANIEVREAKTPLESSRRSREDVEDVFCVAENLRFSRRLGVFECRKNELSGGLFVPVLKPLRKVGQFLG